MEKVTIPEWLQKTGDDFCPSCKVGRGKGFLEKNIETIAAFLKEILEPEGYTNKNGLLQKIDPRAKLFGILLLTIAAAVLKNAIALMGILLLVVMLVKTSKIPFSLLLRRTLPVFIFTLILIFPTMFSFVTPGDVILPMFSINHHAVYISRQGLEGIAILLLRVEAMASLVTVFMLATSYPDIFRALQNLPAPKVFVAALSMTFRYIIVLMKIAEDSHIAKKARTIKPSTLKQGRGWLADRIWLIMEKSLETADGVYMAMTARGFAGDVKTMTAFEMRARDYVWVGFSIFIFLLAIQV